MNFEDQAAKTAELIESTLSALRVPAKVQRVIRGPTVTQYYLRPESHIRIRGIEQVLDDLTPAEWDAHRSTLARKNSRCLTRRPEPQAPRARHEVKLLDTSVAISGEIPARPFTSADCCFLLTPNTRAPAVTLNPTTRHPTGLVVGQAPGAC